MSAALDTESLRAERDRVAAERAGAHLDGNGAAVTRLSNRLRQLDDALAVSSDAAVVAAHRARQASEQAERDMVARKKRQLLAEMESYLILIGAADAALKSGIQAMGRAIEAGEKIAREARAIGMQPPSDLTGTALREIFSKRIAAELRKFGNAQSLGCLEWFAAGSPVPDWADADRRRLAGFTDQLSA